MSRMWMTPGGLFDFASTSADWVAGGVIVTGAKSAVLALSWGYAFILC